VFVVCAAASSTLNALDYPFGPPLGATIALFLYAATSSGVRRSGVALVALLLTVHLATIGIAHDEVPTVPIVFGILAWTIVVFAGDRVRLRRERNERGRQLAAAEERTRIARDLHDSVGHAINVILVQAGAARLLQDQNPEGSRAALETIEAVARQTVGEIDQLVRTLRDDGARSGGVEAAPGLAAVDALIAQHRLAGIEVTVAREGEQPALPATVDQAAYRIVQEALTNAARHGTGSAHVVLRFTPRALEIAVRNPTARGAARKDGGHGLAGMRERAELLGGSLAVTPGPGAFSVEAVLPIGRARG
jgi:signal transduction histidine kinase